VCTDHWIFKLVMLQPVPTAAAVSPSAAGTNFIPSMERVRISHWISNLKASPAPCHHLFLQSQQLLLLLLLYQSAAGTNFIPQFERVHINHWIFKPEGIPNPLPAGFSSSDLRLACFKHCPLNDPSCTPMGTMPSCGAGVVQPPPPPRYVFICFWQRQRAFEMLA
jgi:hypothetical protein